MGVLWRPTPPLLLKLVNIEPAPKPVWGWLIWTGHSTKPLHQGERFACGKNQMQSLKAYIEEMPLNTRQVLNIEKRRMSLECLCRPDWVSLFQTLPKKKKKKEVHSSCHTRWTSLCSRRRHYATSPISHSTAVQNGSSHSAPSVSCHCHAISAASFTSLTVSVPMWRFFYKRDANKPAANYLLAEIMTGFSYLFTSCSTARDLFWRFILRNLHIHFSYVQFLCPAIAST
jgi:hypothetical protein